MWPDQKARAEPVSSWLQKVRLTAPLVEHTHHNLRKTHGGLGQIEAHQSGQSAQRANADVTASTGLRTQLTQVDVPEISKLIERLRLQVVASQELCIRALHLTSIHTALVTHTCKVLLRMSFTLPLASAIV
jgi:hypothetical protein